MTSFKKPPAKDWIVASFISPIETLTSRVCHSARLVGGALCLLSSTLAFGQNSLMLRPTV